jgi:hypothetical protein
MTIKSSDGRSSKEDSKSDTLKVFSLDRTSLFARGRPGLTRIFDECYREAVVE